MHLYGLKGKRRKRRRFHQSVWNKRFLHRSRRTTNLHPTTRTCSWGRFFVFFLPSTTNQCVFPCVLVCLVLWFDCVCERGGHMGPGPCPTCQLQHWSLLRRTWWRRKGAKERPSGKPPGWAGNVCLCPPWRSPGSCCGASPTPSEWDPIWWGKWSTRGRLPKWWRGYTLARGKRLVLSSDLKKIKVRRREVRRLSRGGRKGLHAKLWLHVYNLCLEDLYLMIILNLWTHKNNNRPLPLSNPTESDPSVITSFHNMTPGGILHKTFCFCLIYLKGHVAAMIMQLKLGWQKQTKHA